MARDNAEILKFNGSSGTEYNIKSNILAYANCTTAAGTAAKTVSARNFELVEGANIVVLFQNTNTAANPTLNVNNSGAKAIYYRGAAVSAGYLAANRVYQFTYDGNYWELVGDLNTDTNTWRAIQLNGTAWLTTATSSGILNLKPGTGITLTSASGGALTIGCSITNTDEKVAYVTKTGTDIGRYPVVFGNTTGTTQTTPGSVSIDSAGIIYRPKGAVLELGALEVRNNYITLGTWTTSQTSADSGAKWIKIQASDSFTTGQRIINLPWFSTNSSTHMNLIGKEGPTTIAGPVNITSAGRIEVYIPRTTNSANSAKLGTILYWNGSQWAEALPTVSAGVSLRMSGWNAYWG